MKTKRCPKCNTRTKHMRSSKGTIQWCSTCELNIFGHDFKNGEWVLNSTGLLLLKYW